MSALSKNNHKRARAYMPTSALAKEIEVDDEMLHVLLTDGRTISAPLAWFPLLRDATPEQRARRDRWRRHEFALAGNR